MDMKSNLFGIIKRSEVGSLHKKGQFCCTFGHKRSEGAGVHEMVKK